MFYINPTEIGALKETEQSGTHPTYRPTTL